MSIHTDRLRHAVWLATGEQIESAQADALARMLSDPAEILPHLLLRRAGFQDCPEMRVALEAAIARSPGRPTTPREVALEDSLAAASASTAVREATKALIDRDLGAHEEDARLDRALLDLASQTPAAGWDPSVWIRR